MTDNMFEKLFESAVTANTCSGKSEKNRFKTYEARRGDTCMVFVRGMTDKTWEESGNSSLDPDSGIVITMKPKETAESFVAVYRYCEFWNEPRFGNDLKTVPDETQLLIVKKTDGKYMVMLPVCGERFKCVLNGGESSNEFSARVFAWKNNIFSCDDLAFVFTEGDNPFEMIKSCVKSALETMNSPIKTIDEKTYPQIFEYLGWCTWDSMQIRVSEDGIMEKCKEFRQKSVPVKWAIIDDMWAHIKDFYGQTYADFDEMVDMMHRSALYDFEADPIRFPHGLKGCISKIKDYGIKVGMWYPTTGYWRGIDKYGAAYAKLKDYLIETENGYVVPDWRREKSYMYYAAIFDFFKKCGADFVKIDNQSMTRRYYKGLESAGRVAREYHGGLEAAAGEYFDSCMINCMGTASEDMWNRTVSPITRVSGDFLPENREWFAHHVMQCSYTSLLMGQFYFCDWDMWWTDDGQNRKNSLMRAISGGPVYISDKIGRTEAKILEPLMFDDGRILRCDRVCTPTEDCLTVNPTTDGKALKLQNIANGCGIMAVLNIDEKDRPVSAGISGANVCGFAADEYLAYEYFSKEHRVLRGNKSFNAELKNNDDCRLYIFVPIRDGFAPIGRTDKFIAPKSVEYVCGKQIKLIEDGPYAYFDNGEMHFED